MLELILGLVFPWGLDILRFDPTWLNLEVRVWRIGLVTNILWLCHRASVAPRWHSTCRSPVTLCVFLRRRFCTYVSGLSVSPIARVRHRSTAPPALLGTVASLLSPRPVSHSVRINVLLSLSARIPHQHPSTNLRDMKAGGFDPLFTNPHTTWYILSPTSLFAALKKSDREASQLAPSVPLLSYRRAAGCRGLKGSHWWAVLCRTKALLSNWLGPLQDDFWWITAVIVLHASSFPFPDPLLPSSFSFTMSLLAFLHDFLFYSFPSAVLSSLHPSVSLPTHLSISLNELWI